MKILFIGGTGVISSASVQLASERGMEVVLLNRGKTNRPVPEKVTVIQGDIRKPEEIKTLIRDMSFDVVVDWVAFEPQHIETDLELFSDKTDQFIFISSASVYQTPPSSLPVTESAPLKNPFWEYSRSKIACEERLLKAFREEDFPVTIVRPSHTYDKTLLPFRGNYTMLDRMQKGKKVVVHGDGTSLWTLTHHRDFAKGFVGLLGNPQAIGHAFHITSDEVLTWNQIFETLAKAADGSFHPVYIPSKIIAGFDPDWGSSLLGDKSHSMIFDNTKIKRIVPDFTATIPFSSGAQEIVDWYTLHPGDRVIEKSFNDQLDRMIKKFEKISQN